MSDQNLGHLDIPTRVATFLQSWLFYSSCGCIQPAASQTRLLTYPSWGLIMCLPSKLSCICSILNCVYPMQAPPDPFVANGEQRRTSRGTAKDR